LAALDSAGYTVAPIESETDYFSVTYRDSPSHYHFPVAVLAFQPRVTFIHKTWKSDDSSNFAFAKEFFYASQSLINQGCRSVSIDSFANDRPGATTRTVVLHCQGSNRRFEIMSVDLAAQSSARKQMTATLSEILRRPKYQERGLTPR
jgi:hypothetical protein